MLLGGIGACDDVRFGGTQYAKEIVEAALGTAAGARYGLREARAVTPCAKCLPEGLAESAHDLSDGGLAVALAECSFGPAGIGAQIDLDSDLRPELLAFHEAPSRILISTANAQARGGDRRESRSGSAGGRRYN